MNYSLAHTFGQYRAGRLDPDAKAYIAAVVATGVTVTATQRTAVDTFYKTAKADSYYTSLKRLYLPIWGVAAANAIDMISLTSGTFNGGITHGAGFVQGDGTTGYFNFGATPGSLGLSLASGGLFFLCKAADTRTNTVGIIGCSDNGANTTATYVQIRSSAENIIRLLYANAATQSNASLARNAHTGVLAFIRNSGERNIRRRTTSGVLSLLNQTIGDAGAIPVIQNIVSIAENYAGSIINYNNAELGSYGVTLGMDNTTNDSFTLALKNLWETATGLTLP